MNVQMMRVHILRTFITHLLIHIHQKKKIALEFAAKREYISKNKVTLVQCLPCLLCCKAEDGYKL